MTHVSPAADPSLTSKPSHASVDTSNEIAGDGGVPHPCVGMSRRMMVPNLRDQASVMVECLQVINERTSFVVLGLH